MVGATPVQPSPFFVCFQDQDIRGRFHSGQSYLTDDPSIISGDGRSTSTRIAKVVMLYYVPPCVVGNE